MFCTCHCKSFSTFFEYLEEPYLNLKQGRLGVTRRFAKELNLNYNKQSILLVISFEDVSRTSTQSNMAVQSHQYPGKSFPTTGMWQEHL